MPWSQWIQEQTEWPGWLLPGTEGESGRAPVCTRAHPVLSDSLRTRGLQPARLLCPWDSPGKGTGVGCHTLLQEIFLTQGSNQCLLHPLHSGGFFISSATWEALISVYLSSKLLKLHTLSMYSFLYVNHASIKWVFLKHLLNECEGWEREWKRSKKNYPIEKRLIVLPGSHCQP